MSSDPPPTAFWTPRRRVAALLAVVLAAAVLRLVNLRNSPGWYHDECIYVQQVWNLMHGVFAWDNVAHTYLPRLPFMHLLVMPFFALFGRDVVWIRVVAALSGILTTALIYGIAREIGGRRRAMLAAALFAVLPYTVLLNRWGFSYNIDCMLGAANLLCLQRFARDTSRLRWLWVAAVTAGLGLMVDPVMLGRFLLVGAMVLILARSVGAFAALAAIPMPLALYVGFMLLFQRELFLEDVEVILGERVLESTLPLLLESYWEYITRDGPWLTLGTVGLFLLPVNRASRLLLWSFVLDLAFLLKSGGPDASILFRTGILLAPALCVGMAFALVAGLRNVEAILLGVLQNEGVRRGLLAGGRAAVATGIALLLILPSIRGVQGNFRYNYNEACIFSISEADAVTRWANARLQPDDLVISTHINWMLNAQTTSPMIVDLIRNGQQSAIYFDQLRHRTLRDLSLEGARYAIVHEAFPGMNKHYHFDQTYQEIIQSWKPVHMEGLFRVFENPTPPHRPQVAQTTAP